MHWSAGENPWALALMVAVGAILLWLRLRFWADSLRDLMRRDEASEAKPPHTLGRKIWRGLCGIAAVLCVLHAVGLFAVAGYLALTAPRAEKGMAIVPVLVGLLLLPLARACQRMGREKWRWC